MEERTSTYRLLTDGGELAGVAEILENAKAVGADIETTNLSPRDGKTRLLQLATPEETFVVDMFAAQDLSPLKSVLEDGPVKILHHAKFDHSFLWAEYGISLSPIFDTMLAAQLLDGGEYGPSYALEAVAERYLDETVDKTARAEDWSGELSRRQLEYAARDAAILLPLRERLAAALGDEKLDAVSKIEFGAVAAIAEMELAGVKLDVARWKELEKTVHERRDKAAERLEAHFPPPDGVLPLEGLGPQLNLNSPQQIIDAFRQIGIELPDTRVWTLLKVNHQAARDLLEYRELQKKLGTYLETYASFIHPKTGRIHANFLQCRVPTGRLACTNPNIQQIPNEDEFRRCFVAEEGNVLVIGDYCLGPESRVLTSDLRWVPIHHIAEGDELIGFDEKLGKDSKWRRTSVERATRLTAPCYEVVTETGTVIASADHRWVKRRNVREWVMTSELKAGDDLVFFAQPWEIDNSRDGSYLAGFLDAEGWVSTANGSGSHTLGVAQREGPTLDKVRRLLSARGFDIAIQWHKSGVSRVMVRGGVRENVRLLGTVRPGRLLAKSHKLWEDRWTRSKAACTRKVLAINYLGEREVIGIRTSTGTLIGEGYLMHNSQIELRILAEVSGDPGFVAAFQKGEDLHRVTAATMFGVEKEAVTREQRSAAKRINFGLAYGRGPKSLSAQIGTDEDRARQLIDEYFANYPKVQKYLQDTANEAMRTRTLRTLSGRVRKFGDTSGLSSVERGALRREAMNFPVQGAAADIAKLALGHVRRELRDLDARLINCIHDEFVVECAEGVAPEVSERMRQAMILAGEKLLKKVPVEVEVAVSRDWTK